jgi:hypothetical protein
VRSCEKPRPSQASTPSSPPPIQPEECLCLLCLPNRIQQPCKIVARGERVRMICPQNPVQGGHRSDRDREEEEEEEEKGMGDHRSRGGE